MRRILAILVLLATGLPGLTPLFALSQGAEQKLPACCRRAGIHHCTPSATASSQPDAVSVSAIPSRCPSYPGALPAASHEVIGLATSALGPLRLAVAASLRTVRESSRQEILAIAGTTRGPPAFTL